MKKNKYRVLIIDNFHMDPDEDYVIDGFPTKELSIEFARRWVRSYIEECKKVSTSREKIRENFYMFGEDAIALEANYRASDELDFFIDTPATLEEIDWQDIKKKAKIK